MSGSAATGCRVIWWHPLVGVAGGAALGLAGIALAGTGDEDFDTADILWIEGWALVGLMVGVLW